MSTERRLDKIAVGHGPYCDVHQHGCETKCASCDLRWDTNDPEPPTICLQPNAIAGIPPFRPKLTDILRDGRDIPAAGLTVTDNTLTTAAGAEVIFDELKTIATGFLRRTQEVETQANQIIATVYVNAKKRAEDGDEWCGKLVEMLDKDIARLNALKGKYAVDFAARSASGEQRPARPLVAGPVPEVHGRHDG